MKLCECGCGQPVKYRYINGHQHYGKPGNHRYAPSKEEIPTGLCECGCGGNTPIATTTNSALRWFVGHPRPFIKGHHARVRKQPEGPDSPFFIGRMLRDGYVLIYKPDHPAAYKTPRSRRGYVLEHRLVMERKLGRPLQKGEFVHHVNGVRDDNRPDNLVVLTRSEHRSLHRAEDNITLETRRKLSEATKIAWAEGRMRR